MERISAKTHSPVEKHRELSDRC